MKTLLTKVSAARRRVLFAAMAALALGGAVAAAPAAEAKSLRQVDAEVPVALDQLYAAVPGARSLYRRAHAVLIFPEITKGSFLVGGANGKGALLVGGRTDSYWRYSAVSFGFQGGLQETSQAIFFMTPAALQTFKSGDGFEAGADAEITVIDTGAEVAVDTTQENRPIIAIVYGRKGLKGGVSLQGGKYTRVYK